MYLCFREWGWNPGRYYWLPESEKRIIKVFLRRLLEDRQEEIEEISSGKSRA